MSAGLWPVFQPSVPGNTPDMDGCALLEALDDLDELAGELSVREAGSFADNREVPEDFDGDPDELAQLMGPWSEWFDVDDGIRSLSALADALDDPARAEPFEDPDSVQQELREAVRCLQKAKLAGARFRLELMT